MTFPGSRDRQPARRRAVATGPAFFEQSGATAERTSRNNRPAAARQLALPPWGIVALVVSLFAIAGFQIISRDKILPGVTVVGSPVGWLDRPQATAQLAPNVDAYLARPVQIRYQSRAWTLTAQELGLRANPADLADAAYRVGREGTVFTRLFDEVRSFAGGLTVSIDNAIDQRRLDAALATIAGEIDRAPRDAHVTLSPDGTVDHQPAETGLTLDSAASGERIKRALASAVSAVELVVTETPPTVPDRTVQPAVEQLDRMLGEAPPLTLTRGSESWPLSRADIAGLVSLQGGPQPTDPITVTIDDARLEALVQRVAKDVDQEVQNARFAFNGGNLTVLRPSREGRTLDQPATAALIKAKLASGERVVEIPVAAVAPTVSSDDPASLGIVERIDTGSTSFAGSVPEKVWNIKLAAERLNGVVVPPGATFSFNKEVGPTTLEAGFRWGFGITTGKEGAHTVPSVGGGICQVATTLFQPVFWAGYPLEERYWHLYWIPAYTSRGVVGLDVTVDEDAKLDFKWSNPTNDYVLIQSATDDSHIYFSLYGKKPAWKVDVAEPVITNRVPADQTPKTEEDPTMPWGRSLLVQSAHDGFDVTVTRRVTLDSGGEPRVLSLHSKYVPVPMLTLVGTAGKPADLPTTPTTAPSDVENRPAGQGTDKPREQPAAPSAATPVTAVPGAPPASPPVAAQATATTPPAPTQPPPTPAASNGVSASIASASPTSGR